jgi:transposase
MERFEMGQEELDRLNWLKRAKDGVITQRKAAEKMEVTDRWVRQLLARMEEQGDRVVIHGLRGRASNRRISEEMQKRAVEYLKQPDWYDFGPTFASEQLAKRYDIHVSKETVRGWMIEAGLWESHSRKLKAAHPWRPRRSAYGELTQWDTSDHDWLEGRGEPVRHLVRLIDDATSRSWGRFVKRDGTRENMGVLWEYVEKYGRMVDTYTDRDSMFTIPRRRKETEQQQREADRLTQIGRALRELGIGWIAAYSPQAKGRVERSFETDQDRLIKYLRLAKVTSMKEANEFLEKEYWPEWNERFARPLTGIVDLHRPLTATQDLAASLSHVEHPVIDNGFTFRFAGRRYRILRQDVKAGMRRQRVRIELRLSGEIKARYEGQYVEIAECVEESPSAQREPSHKAVRKDHNAGGKSHWMDGFFESPGPELWQAMEVSNDRN